MPLKNIYIYIFIAKALFWKFDLFRILPSVPKEYLSVFCFVHCLAVPRGFNYLYRHIPYQIVFVPGHFRNDTVMPTEGFRFIGFWKLLGRLSVIPNYRIVTYFIYLFWLQKRLSWPSFMIHTVIYWSFILAFWRNMTISSRLSVIIYSNFQLIGILYISTL